MTFLICLSLSVAEARAADVLVLQSLWVKPFNEALAGFRSICKADTETISLSDYKGMDILKIVREKMPRLVVAIGADALQKVSKIRDIPILYIMVLNPEKIVGVQDNIVGLDMNVPPEKYLNLMEKINLPKLKIGILFDPENTGAFVNKIRQAARSKGIDIVAKEVHNPHEVPDQLETMKKDSLSVFWMLPDSTVVTSETVELLLLFSQQNRIPVISFAGKYVDTGALFSLDIDGFELGTEGGEMANKILDGYRLSELPDTTIRKTTLKVNQKVANKLGINLNSFEPRSFSN